MLGSFLPHEFMHLFYLISPHLFNNIFTIFTYLLHLNVKFDIILGYGCESDQEDAGLVRHVWNVLGNDQNAHYIS